MLLLEKLEQKRKFIVLVMLACILIGIIVSLFIIPKKTIAVANLMIIEVNDAEKPTSNGSLELTKKMVANFEEIIKSESNVIALNKDLKNNVTANDLKNKVKVKSVSNSDTFKIIVENSNVDLAVKINNSLINIFSEKLKTIYANSEVYVIDSAHIEENINYLMIIKVLLLSVFMGALINVCIIVLLVEIDKKVKKSNDLEAELSIKNLGQIPLYKSKNKLISYNEKNIFSNAFSTLRSNIQFINVAKKEKNIILVTSAQKGEGKTLVSANMGIDFAKTGKKIILIDADMKSGNMNKMFNIPNDLGLSNYLSGIDENGNEVNDRINKFIKDTSYKNLNVITSGTVPPNSSELLTLPKFEEMIKDLSVFYDIIIIDGTEVLNETDALILTRVVNSTLIVSTYKKTKKDDLWQTKRDIQNVGGKIIGIIINKIKIKENNENIIIKAKKLIKEKYIILKDLIISKREKRKQKLLEAAIIEEKQKNVEELKKEENKLLSEIEKEIKTEEKVTTKNEKEEKKEEPKKDNIIIVEEQKNVKEDNLDKNVQENIMGEIPVTSKFELIKEKTINAGKFIKENSSNLISKASSFVKKETEKLKEIKTNIEEKKIEKEKEILAQEKVKESQEIINNTDDKNSKETTSENKEINENSVLVIVDPENGYCRAFSQICFTEKLIRGIDKTDGFVKANYSSSLVNRKNFSLMSKYELTSKQVNRIDPLIYSVLQEYDDCIWIEKKTTSNKAEDYVFCMAKDYERNPEESKANYELRCQYLRKVELAKAQIEIEYHLENIWNSRQLTFTDKIVCLKYAKLFENLKRKKKLEKSSEKTSNNSKINELMKKIKNPIELLKKVKINQVKAKTVEELTKEVEQAQNDFENYRIEDYTNLNEMTEYDLEEQRIKEEEQEMLKQQLLLKKELKEKKAKEKAQKKEERIKRREEQRKNKELKRQKAKEEARIEEELSEDNLYPKTKYNKNL